MKRNYKLDFLRFISAIAIVIIHVNTDYMNLNENNLIVKNFFQYGMRFAVPLFFLISGYLYFKSSNKNKIILKNLKIYIYISILYILLNYIVKLLGVDLLISPIFWFFEVLIILQILFLDSNKTKNLLLITFSIIIYFFTEPEIRLIKLTIPFIPIFYIGSLLRMLDFNKFKSNYLALISLSFFLILSYLNIMIFNLGQYNYLTHIIAILLFLSVMLLDFDFKEKSFYYSSLDIYLYHSIIICILQYILFRYDYLYFFNDFYFISIIFITILTLIIIIIFQKLFSVFIKEVK